MLNKVILIGRLGADPDVHHFTSGEGIVVSINLATSLRWKDKKTGEKKEKTEWHRVVFFNTPFSKLADIASEYLKKGSLVYIEGRLQTRKWQTAEGHDRYTTEIVAMQMQMLSSRSGGTSSFDETTQENKSTYQNRDKAAQTNNESAALPPMPPAPASYDNFDDDIPF